MPKTDPGAFKSDDGFKDPESQNRECTDLFFLFVFVLFWIGMFIVGGIGYSKGSPNRMVWPEDTRGDTCGMNNTLFNSKGADLILKPVLFFVNPTNPRDLQVCMKECPKTGNLFASSFSLLPILIAAGAPGYSLFEVPCPWQTLVAGCPNPNISAAIRTSNEQICPPPPNPLYPSCAIRQGEKLGSIAYEKYVNGDCFCPYPSKPVQRRCIPEAPVGNYTGRAAEIQAQIQAQQDAIKDNNPAVALFGEFVDVWWWILITVGIAVFFCFVYLFLLKKFSHIMVYVTIFLVVAVFAATAAAFIIVGNNIIKGATSEQGQSQGKTITYIGYAFAAVTGILILVICFMWKRIQLAIDIIKEASQAIQSMPELVFFPLVLVAAFICFLVYWLTALLWLASAKTYDEKLGKWIYDKTTQNSIAYHFFGFLWQTNMLVALCYVTVAGAVAQWYWTGCGEVGGVDTPSAVPKDAVKNAFKRAWNYHLGSICLGSLILAIIQFLRACFEFSKKHLEAQLAANAAAFPEAVRGVALGCVKCCLCCCSCCFKCLEEFARFLTQSAYIMIAIKGTNFVTSAVSAFFLVGRNILRIIAVDFIGDALLAAGKYMITIVVGVISIIFLTGYVTSPDAAMIAAGDSPHPLRFWFLIWLVTVMLTYGIATLFMAVFELTIDTILFCFCEDCERNDGSAARPYKMSGRLKEFTDHHSQEPKK